MFKHILIPTDGSPVAAKAIQAGITLAAEMGAGVLKWESVDYDKPAHGHFVKDYGLSASALVLVPAADEGQDHWRKLDRIWDLVGDEAAFKTYVTDEMRAILRGVP